ncbi:MAG: exo-alpha-sialidase [Acidobacteriaceae bacterium]
MKIVCLMILAAVIGAVHSDRNSVNLLQNRQSLIAPMQLPLASSVTSPVYRAQAGQWQFNLHSYIAWYKGKFWAIWSSGKVNEDNGQQRIDYATSSDGHHWSAAGVLVDSLPIPALWIARGIFTQNGHLYAFAASSDGSRKNGMRSEAWHNLRLVRFEWYGSSWHKLGTYLDNCMNNFPPRPFGGHLFMTCRDSYGVMHTAVSSSLDGLHWTVTKLPGKPPVDDMSEPSWYIDPQGTGHLIFRDAGGSKYLYQSISHDQGRTWSTPTRTNYPDATSKNFSGRLSNGWYYLINNPNQKARDPLAISFSRDGWSFSHPIALRKGAPPLRYSGKHKGGHGSFQYPQAMEHRGSLWAIYSTNKEDIEISEYKLSDFNLPKS